MKKLLPILLLTVAFVTSGQNKPAISISFPDSVRIVLENTKNMDATTVGAAFAGVWGNIGYDLQALIRQQSKKIYKKGYRLRPEITNYFGAIADAINLEAADPEKLNSFLSVTGKVIDNDNRDKANLFFVAAREFFEHHALHYEKSFQLSSTDDDFTFEYVADASFDPMASNTPPDTLSAWQTNTNPDSLYSDTTSSYLPPPPAVTPPPSITGPIIRFKRISLLFSTPYDSAVLSNTKGVYSMRDRIFVGENGRFDWTSAGLSKDSVFFDITAPYFFKVTKPEFKAELGNMTYYGRTPGKVQGMFEFKSASHKTKKDALWPKFTSFENNIATRGLKDPKLTFTGGFSMQGSKVSSASLNGGMSTLELAGEIGKKFTIQSKSFDLQDSLISAKQSLSWIFHGSDTIYHPAVDFRYNMSSQSVFLTKSKSGLKDAPFASSFFDVDFSTDEVRWLLESDSINLYTAGGYSQVPMII